MKKPDSKITVFHVLGGEIKAVGDMRLQVLGAPFYGPEPGGKDLVGDYFSPKTDFVLKVGETVPVLAFHGQHQDKPERLGTAKISRKDDKGLWFEVVLNKTSALARKLYAKAREGLLRASTGAMAVRRGAGKEILHWLLSELSLVDLTDNQIPANAWATAVPMKAYKALINEDTKMFLTPSAATPQKQKMTRWQWTSLMMKKLQGGEVKFEVDVQQERQKVYVVNVPNLPDLTPPNSTFSESFFAKPADQRAYVSKEFHNELKAQSREINELQKRLDSHPEDKVARRRLKVLNDKPDPVLVQYERIIAQIDAAMQPILEWRSFAEEMCNYRVKFRKKYCEPPERFQAHIAEVERLKRLQGLTPELEQATESPTRAEIDFPMVRPASEFTLMGPESD